MASNKWTILAKVIVKLDQYGFSYKVNKPLETKHEISGYRKVVLDLAVLRKDGTVLSAFYIGPPKQRRVLKYRSLKIRVFYIHSEDQIEPVVSEFIKDYAKRII